MSFPAWFFNLWLAGSIVAAVLFTAIATKRMLLRWPSLALAAAFEIAAFIALQHQSYMRYFWIWYLHACFQAVLRVTVLADILRSVPGGSLMPRWLKFGIGTLSIGGALIVAWLLLQNGLAGGALARARVFDEAAKFAWAAMIVFLLYGIAFSGFTFTMTGMRIATAYIVRMVVSMVSALLYTRHLSTRLNFEIAAIDTFAAMWFFAYCTFAILRDADSLRLTNPITLNQPEKAGQA